MKIDIYNHVMPMRYLDAMKQHSKDPGIVKRMAECSLWHIRCRARQGRCIAHHGTARRQAMVARDIMTTRVLTVAPQTSIEEVARLLLSHRISAVPVVDAEDRLVGIVSEGDLMRRPETGTERHASWWLRLLGDPDEKAREYAKTHGRHASDVMTRSVITVSEETPVAEIARVLEERRIKRVPVVRDGRVIGIVSRADLLRGLASRHQAEPAPSADDGDLRKRVLEALHSLGFGFQAYAIVTDGVVHLWGLAESEDQRRALRVAAENVPGVRGVEDHLGYVPPHLRIG